MMHFSKDKDVFLKDQELFKKDNELFKKDLSLFLPLPGLCAPLHSMKVHMYTFCGKTLKTSYFTSPRETHKMKGM